MADRKRGAATVPKKQNSEAYTPTERETAVVNAQYERQKRRPLPAPRIALSKGDDLTELSIDHPGKEVGLLLLMEAVGTGQVDFLKSLLVQLADAGSKPGQPENADNVNFMLSVINGIEPQDEIEAMLAAQMAAVHMATMTFAKRLANVENIPQQDSAEKAFNKLARTFTSQVEALKRYRTGGEQKMTVEHVTVNDGGQAIVGNVSGGGRQKK